MSISSDHLKVIQESINNPCPVFFSAEGVDILFQTRVLELRAQEILVANAVGPKYIGKVSNAKRFVLQIMMYQFESTKIESDGVDIVFPLEQLKTLEETRQRERRYFSPEDHVYFEFLNPYDDETILRKSVMDLSNAGLSLRSPYDSRLLRPGQRLEKAKVLKKGELYFEGDSEVVYKRLFIAQDGSTHYQVGLKFVGNEI